MTALGINCDGRAAIAPAALAALGARWVRAVAYPDAYVMSWMQGCRARGVRVLLVLASESIGQNASLWSGNIAMYRDRYGGLVDAWQLGNESDHVSDSSWTMTQAALSQLLRTGRTVLGPRAYIVGPGLVSGQPDWARGVDWGPVQALACHPYARWPGTPELDWLLEEYAGLGKPLWATEYNARTIGMAAALRDDPRLQVALAFCYSDSMVSGFGLIEDADAMADFKAATSGPANHPPQEQHAAFQAGFKEIADRHPDIVGTPRENESGPWRNCSLQRTDKGWLVWGNFAEGIGDQKGFVADDLTRWVWDGSRLRKRT